MNLSPLQWLLVLLTFAVVFALAAFVWPTLYRYDHIQWNGGNFPVRINRFTQRADILMDQLGWHSMDSP